MLLIVVNDGSAPLLVDDGYWWIWLLLNLIELLV